MKWIIGTYPDYGHARIGTEKILGELSEQDRHAFTIVREDVVRNSTVKPRGADLKEISGDLTEKGAGGEPPDISRLTETDLGWIDHALVNHKPIQFADTGSVVVAGEFIESWVAQALAGGVNTLHGILESAKIEKSQADTLTEGVNDQKVIVGIGGDGNAERIAEQMREQKIEPIFVSEG